MAKFLNKLRSICNEKVQERMYFLALFLYSFRMVFRNSLIIQFSSYAKLLIYLAIYALILPKNVLQKYNKKQLIVTGCILALGIVAYGFNRTRNILAIVFILCGIKDCDLKKAIKIVFFVTALFVGIHIFAYFYDHFYNGGTLIDIPLFDRSDERRSTVLCKSYNNFGAVTSFLTIQYIYLTDRRKNAYLKLLLLTCVSFFFYAVGTSRTSLLISLMVSFSILLEKNEKITGKMRNFRRVIFLGCVIFSILMFFMDINNPLVQRLNILLSGRIRYCVLANQTYGLSFFPQVGEMLKNPIILDNFVDYLIVVYGFALTGLFLILVYYVADNRKNDWLIEYMMIITYIWAITERYPLYVTLTVVPLVSLYNFYRDCQNEE